jgi:hypothetical protein
VSFTLTILRGISSLFRFIIALAKSNPFLFTNFSNAKSCCRISIRETTYVPPNTEIIAKGQLMDLISKDLVGLVER